MPSPYRREELIADTATLVYLLSGANHFTKYIHYTLEYPPKKEFFGGKAGFYFVKHCLSGMILTYFLGGDFNNTYNTIWMRQGER
jgi:hypothetical protein